MGRTENSGGDVLARGGVKATFRQPNVSKKKYAEAVNDFNLARFLSGGSPIEPPLEPVKKERKRA
jgi:hypothetical protein